MTHCDFTTKRLNMPTDIIQIIQKNDICHECHKKKATKLCDFALGESRVTFYRSYSLFKEQKTGLISCDNPQRQMRGPHA